MNGPLQSAFPDPSRSPGLLLWRVTNSWQRRVREALSPLGLTHAQFVLLASLVVLGEEQPITQRELADFSGIDPMTTSKGIRALESRGLAERVPHPTDRRAQTLTATATGADLASRATAAVEQADRDYFSVLGACADRLTDLLGALDTEHRGTK